ncbi:gluconolactonase [Gracilibacillus oryzae]|uniref:Gluconolactonase n=1 Tax=Gracilibacillus oryzae TaxID=1672701 RepID=A0A7C8KR52_9BACI|nr:NHL repeat-containing protein [Gracilibacillus oryzae]KAB8125807.1 gluconolactonase [Gracilibacillus oryzae]
MVRYHTLTRIIVAFALFLCLFSPIEASAAVSYPSYNYSYWENTDPSPLPYTPEKVIDGRGTSYGLLNSPEDVFVSKDNTLYIVDSGNNRIIVLDENYELIQVIDTFQNGTSTDQFNDPKGIFVTEEGSIYVADTGNQRVIELTEEGEFIREIGAPQSDVIRTGFEYHPIKIAVDKADRIYVIGRGVYDGIIEFDSDGIFTGFIGANRVRFNPIDYVWRIIATEEQREKMALFIPIEFNNLDIDEEGFIYTTNAEEDTSTPIQRLNPTGEDVLRKEGYHELIGDLEYAHTGSSAGTSTFVDVSINQFGMYSALDIKRGRVFTYDEDGNLLYIFGQLGDQVGTFRTPVAIDQLGEDIIVLDKGNHRLTVFKPTVFGSHVNQAVHYYNQGDDQASAEYWKEVLQLNANYEIAYIGIGKSLLMEGKNKEAMTYFKNGHSRSYYSKAYKRYRQEILREHFGLGMTVMVCFFLCVASLITFRKIKRRKVSGVENGMD